MALGEHWIYKKSRQAASAIIREVYALPTGMAGRVKRERWGGNGFTGQVTTLDGCDPAEEVKSSDGNTQLQGRERGDE